jgi:hypothetical protein
MAVSTSATGSPVSEADLTRAQEFACEPFVLEGEDAATVLAAGTPPARARPSRPSGSRRRRALAAS